MLYLNKDHITRMGNDWQKLTSLIGEAVASLADQKYSQPIKIYLRYRSPQNRIIAMPAYIEAKDEAAAGLKWIASFPDNVTKGLPRANSVTILNEVDTGVPLALINTAKVSSLRTAAVSGFTLKNYTETKNINTFSLGIIGMGPIGTTHLEMVQSLYGDKVKILAYDANPQILKTPDYPGVSIAKSTEEIVKTCDVVIVCTNALTPHISTEPKEEALILNVSLRDFVPDYYKYVKGGIIVDDWEEVNREGTNIEMFSQSKGLTKDAVYTLGDLLSKDFYFQSGKRYMLNPMGMAVFDVMVGNHYYREALHQGIGISLPD